MQKYVSVRKQFEKKLNRAAALGLVGVIAALLLYDGSLWTVLLPLWFFSWITLHVIFQKLATEAENAEFRVYQSEQKIDNYLNFKGRSQHVGSSFYSFDDNCIIVD